MASTGVPTTGGRGIPTAGGRNFLPPVAPPPILFLIVFRLFRDSGVPMPDADEFAPDRWEMTGEPTPTMTPRARRPRPRQTERFLRGPVPWPWLSRAMILPGKALPARDDGPAHGDVLPSSRWRPRYPNNYGTTSDPPAGKGWAGVDPANAGPRHGGNDSRKVGTTMIDTVTFRWDNYQHERNTLTHLGTVEAHHRGKRDSALKDRKGHRGSTRVVVSIREREAEPTP